MLLGVVVAAVAVALFVIDLRYKSPERPERVDVGPQTLGPWATSNNFSFFFCFEILGPGKHGLG